ncbi:ASCH domain-containing protein [Salinibacterium sp. SYSU T00001]|uniref:ASCH domain-containing protein n=1 Tax=Homoserinimonas sedimenticola TaxID=2986805 RepID=UPI002235F1E6|nr:ASCH domain-containing protein [Salinibacterium sedimenticola]MCW4386297.1 ASCH domain-containing protein [Salinibacterium sedimenticola]
MTSPLPEPDMVAAAAMWQAYRDEVPGPDGEHPTVEYFGDSAELADELLALVLEGQKRATATLFAEFEADGQPVPQIGGHWIACDGRGTPVAVLRSTELRLGTLESVDDAFAYDEGEGDRTRESWVRSHTRYWQRGAEARGIRWSEQESEIVFERFTVVWPPEHRTP